MFSSGLFIVPLFTKRYENQVDKTIYSKKSKDYNTKNQYTATKGMAVNIRGIFNLFTKIVKHCFINR
jgi:hypothetical protein